MSQVIQLIRQEYRASPFRFSIPYLLLGGFTSSLLFMLISSITAPITHTPILLIANLLWYAVLYWITLPSCTILLILLHNRSTISTLFRSDINHSKDRILGNIEIREDIEEIRGQVISLGAYLASIGKVTNAEQLAPMFYHIDQQLNKIPQLEAKLETEIKTRQTSDREHEKEKEQWHQERKLDMEEIRRLNLELTSERLERKQAQTELRVLKEKDSVKKQQIGENIDAQDISENTKIEDQNTKFERKN